MGAQIISFRLFLAVNHNNCNNNYDNNIGNNINNNNYNYNNIDNNNIILIIKNNDTQK